MRKLIITSANRIFLATADDASLRLPLESEISVTTDAETFAFGEGLAVSPSAIAGGLETLTETGLRETWTMIPPEDYALAVKGAELLNWNESERYCPRDGHTLVRHSEISKRCPLCGAEYFPRLNPAIVVLVTKDDRALLVHSRNLKSGIHALVAGFVETGESLEDCVVREIKEETDLEVEDVEYFGSQAWPFPFQLMIGFTAKYKSGKIRFADGELSSGDFFTRDSVPPLPTLPSLSRRIIDAWINREIGC